MANTHSADPTPQVEGVTPNITSRVRTSASRADRLQAFICGHLPTGIDVEVVLTPAVKTAAVLPAEDDALVRSDATELERQQAAQLLESVDAEFLILVTTDPAPIYRIPVNDQLTADHAHQFGLAFHELLHILKTAIGPIAELLETEIDPDYRQQVHDLINIIEDGAIEREAIHGSTVSRAPAFTLPGTTGGDWTIHRLGDYTREGVTVIGFFGRESLEAARPLSWLTFDDDIDVLVVSDAECSELSGEAMENSFGFPLLGDPEQSVAVEYGADLDAMDTGSVFLVDSSEYIRRRWEDRLDAMAVYDAATMLMERDASLRQRGGD